MTILRNDVKMTPFEKSNTPRHFEHDDVGTMKLYRKTDLRHTYGEKIEMPQTNNSYSRFVSLEE